MHSRKSRHTLRVQTSDKRPLSLKPKAMKTNIYFLSAESFCVDVFGCDEYENFYHFETYGFREGENVYFDPCDELAKCSTAIRQIKEHATFENLNLIFQ